MTVLTTLLLLLLPSPPSGPPPPSSSPASPPPPPAPAPPHQHHHDYRLPHHQPRHHPHHHCHRHQHRHPRHHPPSTATATLFPAALQRRNHCVSFTREDPELHGQPGPCQGHRAEKEQSQGLRCWVTVCHRGMLASLPSARASAGGRQRRRDLVGLRADPGPHPRPLRTFTADARRRSRSSSCWCSLCSSLPLCSSFCFSSSLTAEEKARPRRQRRGSRGWAVAQRRGRKTES